MGPLEALGWCFVYLFVMLDVLATVFVVEEVRKLWTDDRR